MAGAGLLLTRAMAWRQQGRSDRAQVYFDSARVTLEQRVAGVPEDHLRGGELGFALAGLGMGAEAVRVAERGLALRHPTRDAIDGPLLVANLARIQVLLGHTDKAVAALSQVLSKPGPLSPAWLRSDPLWAPLRRNPVFERLLRQ